MKRISLQLLTATTAIAILLGLSLAVTSAHEKKQKGNPAAQGPAAEGAVIFKKNCNMCHFPDKAERKIGPGLKGVFKNKELPATHKPTTEANVREQIEKGNKKKGMPPFGDKFTPAELESLLAYLKTL